MGCRSVFSEVQYSGVDDYRVLGGKYRSYPDKTWIRARGRLITLKMHNNLRRICSQGSPLAVGTLEYNETGSSMPTHSVYQILGALLRCCKAKI